MNKLAKGNLVRGLPSKLFENDQTCVACQKGKQHRASSTKDETNGIHKSFITGIENLVDHKDKVIRCDNGTEFKNKEMNQFCEMKGNLRQCSVARTPQQNIVSERRNRTLIEVARTMLVDSKLPTTFGQKQLILLAIPFGCLDTILNTIDHLEKFDGKAGEGFFVRYSLNSKAFGVFNSRTRIVEENLHIRFSESTPNVVGSKACDNAGQARKETKPVKDYILLPLWTADPPFSQDLKSSQDDGSKPSSDDGNKVDKDSRKDSEGFNQEKEDNVNSTNNVNAAITNEVNAIDGKISIELPFDPNMPELEDYSIFDSSRNDEDDGAEADMNNLDTTFQASPNPTTRIHKDHPLDQVIGDLQSATQTKRMSKNLEEHGFEEPKKVIHTLKDPSWIEAMQEELLQFKLQEVWTLVDLPNRKRVIGTKWVFRNKKDERGIIEEEVYVCQPLGFEDPDFPDRVYKVEKALYGLHQAPRAWYETLSTYLLDNGFQRGKINKTLFIKRHKGDILLVQVYVDDIIFGSTKKGLCIAFEKLMHEKFQMSSIGELTFFLGLQVKQKKDGIFISQDKYVDEILKKFGFTEVKTASTPMETQKPLLKDEDGEEVDVYMYRSMIGSLMYLTSLRPDIMFAVCACARYQVNPKVSHLHAVKRIFRYLKGQLKLGLWYPKDSPFDLVAYTDSDYAGTSLDRKSTIGGCQFLGYRLISWQCKKQTVVANSITEAEYVAASSMIGCYQSCCGQAILASSSEVPSVLKFLQRRKLEAKKGFLLYDKTKLKVGSCWRTEFSTFEPLVSSSTVLYKPDISKASSLDVCGDQIRQLAVIGGLHISGQGFNGSDYTTWGLRKLDGYDDGFILLTQKTEQAATENLYSAIYMKLISSLKDITILNLVVSVLNQLPDQAHLLWRLSRFRRRESAATPPPPFCLPYTYVTLPPFEEVRYRFWSVILKAREIMQDLERDVSYGITDTWDEMLVDMPGAPETDETELGRRMTNFVTTVRHDTNEIYDVSRGLGRSIDASDLACSELMSRTTVIGSAADRRRQAQFIEVLKLMKRLQTQMTEFQRQHVPAKGPAQPDAPKEAGSSS
ncbi:putative ribonuclease H-like domain-containing protein [Tanacetum coccineum]|uniref:Ribonuclease H-like domain-containing protein n=1 Tax=Tanacetum coccineum TaxID=301880 RepID=A0ABQ5D4L2_9ASTR